MFSCLGYAQITNAYIFNKYNTVDTGLVSVVAVKPTNNGYLYVGDIDAVNGFSGTYMQTINQRGEKITTHILYGETCYSTIYLGGCLQYSADSNFVVAFNKGSQYHNMNFMLIKFQENGQVLWLHEYERQYNQNTAQVVSCFDGGFLITGLSQQYFTPTSVGPARIHVIKTDNNGEEEWEYIYPANNVGPTHASQTADGGYIISGYQYNTATGYDMYALKIDALGMVEWEKTYGTPVDDGGCSVQSYPLGGYYLVGLKWVGGFTKALYSAWLDDAGNVIYSKTISKNEVFIIDSNPVYLEDGSYVGVTNSYGPPPIWEVAFTTFNNSGEIVSEIPISSGLPGEDYIRDLEPTPDGGYILAGFNYTVPQSSWVVKLGPNGEYCGTAPCLDSLYVTAITPPHNETITRAEVYPNPAKGSATITYTLPPQLPFAVLELYNLQGEKVRYWVLQPSPNPSQREEITQTLNLEGILPGMYVWRLALPGGYEQYEVSGKVVVE